MTWTGRSSSSDMFKILKQGFDFYQERAKTTATYYRDSINEIDPEANAPNLRLVLKLAYAALGLGEQGEVQGKIKKIIRDSNGEITGEKRQAIGAELSDQLWYIAMVADELGLSFGDLAVANLRKLQSRKERGTLKGSGDVR